MFKKVMLLAVSAAALLAFAIPAFAQATTLTENGTAIAKGSGVTATSTNLTTVTALGNLNCAKVTLHFSVVTNPPLVLAPVGEAGTSGCTTSSGKFVTIDDGTVLENLSLTGGEGTVKAKFTTTIYNDAAHTSLFITCTFNGTLAVAVSGTDSIAVEGTLLSPVCGEGVMSGEFTVETSNGTALDIDV